MTTTAPTSSPTTAPASDGGPFFAAVVHLSAGIAHHLNTLEHDQLYRGRPGSWDQPAIWKCLNHFVRPHLEVDPSQEARWGLLAVGLARMPHDTSENALTFGVALGRTGYQESHFIALLRQDPEDPAFAQHLLRALAYLDGKRVRLSWFLLATWIFTLDEARLEDLRLRFARDYYRAVHAST